MLRLKAKLKDSKCDPILFRQHLEISDKDAERFLVTFLGPSYSTRDEKQVKQRMTLENLKRDGRDKWNDPYYELRYLEDDSPLSNLPWQVWAEVHKGDTLARISQLTDAEKSAISRTFWGYARHVCKKHKGMLKPQACSDHCDRKSDERLAFEAMISRISVEALQPQLLDLGDASSGSSGFVSLQDSLSLSGFPSPGQSPEPSIQETVPFMLDSNSHLAPSSKKRAPDEGDVDTRPTKRRKIVARDSSDEYSYPDSPSSSDTSNVSSSSSPSPSMSGTYAVPVYFDTSLPSLYGTSLPPIAAPTSEHAPSNYCQASYLCLNNAMDQPATGQAFNFHLESVVANYQSVHLTMREDSNTTWIESQELKSSLEEHLR